MAECKYPSVTQTLLAEVVNRIRSAGDPLKVVLFGSWARGEAHAESDLDVLVVEESDLPRFKRSPRYYKALMGVCFSRTRRLVLWRTEPRHSNRPEP